MKFVLAILAVLAICAPAQAQAQKVYSQAELDALLAPIALQPDGVVSQVLIAATYPEDVAAAAAWSRANPYQRGDAAVRAVEQEPWDPAVKSLLAFPELLARMDESPQWLHDLGEAFLSQQPQVMDTVQGLRRRAQANGQLATTNDTAVYQQGEAIVVQPRSEIVYVRYYDPYVVYGPWWWGPYYAPVIWRPWRPYPVVVVRGFFYSQPDWHHHHVSVIHRPVYAHPQQAHVVPGRWQHHAPIARSPAHQPQARPYVRVPESQRKPIVQSQQPMPAANGWSPQSQRRDAVRPPVQAQQPQHSQPQRQPAPQRSQRAVEPRRQAENHGSRGRSGGNEHRGRAEQRGHRG